MKLETLYRSLIVLMLALILYLLAPSKVRPDPCTGEDVRQWIKRAHAAGYDLPDFEHRSQW